MNEMRQRATNTPHTTTKGTLPQRNPGIETKKLPKAVATNQPPIMVPLSLGGATFDTNEMPIGESNNSPNVNTKYVLMSQLGDTVL